MTHQLEFSNEDYIVFQKEDPYIQAILGVTKEKTSSNCPIKQDGFEPKFGVCKNVTLDNNYRTLINGKEKEFERKVELHVTSHEQNITGDENLNDYLTRELEEKFNYHKLPTDLQKLLWGIYRGLPNTYNVPNDKKPDWLDMEKFKIGQQFTQKYYTCLNFSDMLSLIILFSFPDILETLIYTGNSGTPFTAFRRYLKTALRVTSWFENDIWSKNNLGHQNMKTVRALHLNTSKRLNSAHYKDLENQLTLIGSSNKPKLWSTKKQELLNDFKSCCPFADASPLDNRSSKKIYISQLDMSITQFVNVGLIVTYPEKFGASGASREELEGFLHMWRGIGYLLGIDDEFNFCSGTFEEVIQRCHHVLDFWVKPNLQNITEDWEHMSRCLAEGLGYVFGFSNMFEPSMMYLCWVLGIPTVTFEKSLTFSQTCAFNFVRFTMTYTLRAPGMLTLHNWFLRRAMIKASSLTPKQLNQLENRKYDYQTTSQDSQKKKVRDKSSKTSLLVLLYILRFLI